jgi:hypothetical protein
MHAAGAIRPFRAAWRGNGILVQSRGVKGRPGANAIFAGSLQREFDRLSKYGMDITWGREGNRPSD